MKAWKIQSYFEERRHSSLHTASAAVLLHLSWVWSSRNWQSAGICSVQTAVSWFLSVCQSCDSIPSPLPLSSDWCCCCFGEKKKEINRLWVMLWDPAALSFSFLSRFWKRKVNKLTVHLGPSFFWTVSCKYLTHNFRNKLLNLFLFWFLILSAEYLLTLYFSANVSVDKNRLLMISWWYLNNINRVCFSKTNKQTNKNSCLAASITPPISSTSFKLLLKLHHNAE